MFKFKFIPLHRHIEIHPGETKFVYFLLKIKWDEEITVQAIPSITLCGCRTIFEKNRVLLLHAGVRVILQSGGKKGPHINQCEQNQHARNLNPLACSRASLPRFCRRTSRDQRIVSFGFICAVPACHTKLPESRVAASCEWGLASNRRWRTQPLYHL